MNINKGRLCQSLDPSQSCIPTQNGEGGVLLWSNADGMADVDGVFNGSEWTPHCVTAEHNTGWHGDPSMLFNASTPTQAYTSLQPLGRMSGARFQLFRSRIVIVIHDVTVLETLTCIVRSNSTLVECPLSNGFHHPRVQLPNHELCRRTDDVTQHRET
jgi:hypothetical protein